MLASYLPFIFYYLSVRFILLTFLFCFFTLPIFIAIGNFSAYSTSDTITLNRIKLSEQKNFCVCGVGGKNEEISL